MYNIYLLSKYTFREALAKKIFIVFFGILTFILLVFTIIFFSVDPANLAGSVRPQGNLSFEDLTLNQFVATNIAALIITPLFHVGLFLSIFAVSGFIPALLEKGNVDLFLSKPVSRTQLILGKFFGGAFMVFLNVAWLVGGIWILFGLFLDVWSFNILVTIFTITFAFASIYGIIILTGILTKSSIMAMMISYLIYFVFSPLLRYRESIAGLTDSKVTEYMLDALYYIFPKISELGDITVQILIGSSNYSYQPVITTLLFTILILATSIFIFGKKDF